MWEFGGKIAKFGMVWPVELEESRMLSAETRLHINDTEVTATLIDGEAIMINLNTGVYYGIAGAGARIWQLSAAGASQAEISELAATEYSIDHDQAAGDVARLFNQFVDEGLLVPHIYPNVPQLPSQTAQTSYETPELDIYREMGHLLALDPPMPGLENITWDEPSHA
jgi:hypothetical protein